MLPDDIHHVYLQAPRGSLHPAGRFLVHDGQVHHLEDYHGLLHAHVPEGVIDDYTLVKLSHPGPGMKIASRSAIRSGHRLDVLPAAQLAALPEPAPVTPQRIRRHVEVKPPSVFHYTRAGHDRPHVLEVRDGQYLLDGNPLKDDEVAAILDNVRSKAGKLRYARSLSQDAVAKAEVALASLRKEEDEMDLAQAFQHLGAAAQAGHVPRAAVDALRRQIYTDPMAPGLGNKYAFNEFQAKKKPGVWVSLDGNDFKAINDLYGHQAGDDAIRAFGRAAREAMDEAVGSGQSKLFRNPDEQDLYRAGGDEFVAHVPSYEHAAAFARALRNKLDAFPPLQGQHKISMSMGFGHDYASADKALGHAKEQKYSGPVQPGVPRIRRFPVGKTPSLAHSLVPGHEGAVPLDEEHAQAQPPKLPAEPRSAAPAAPTAS